MPDDRGNHYYNMPDDQGNHYYNMPNDQGTDAYLIAYLIATSSTPRRRRHWRPSLGAAAAATDGPPLGLPPPFGFFRPCAMCPSPPFKGGRGIAT